MSTAVDTSSLEESLQSQSLSSSDHHPGVSDASVAAGSARHKRGSKAGRGSQQRPGEDELVVAEQPAGAGEGDGDEGTRSPQKDEATDSSPEAFREWLTQEFRACAAYERYSELMDKAIDAVCRWRDRFWGERDIWARMMRRDRMIKELNECAPIIEHTVEIVSRLQLEEGGDKAVVLDVCSGYGYMSMLLSELLPPDRVQKIVMLDRQWPMLNQEAPSTNQISWGHVKYPGWPIPLETSKRDLKAGRTIRDLDHFLFNAAGLRRPILLLGVHLCSTLSIRAVEIFNHFPTAVSLALKPCCLPPMGFVRERPPRTWTLGEHTIPSKEVCGGGNWNKGHMWIGERRGNLAGRFNNWADHLCAGLCPDEGCECSAKRVDIQVQTTHFQNAFIFAERNTVDQPWKGTNKSLASG